MYATRALELTQAHKERGNQAWAWWVQGEVDARSGRASTEQIAASYQRALSRAEELHMRPLQAHCRLGLGTMYGRRGQVETGRRELATARDLYRAMAMPFWRRQAESALSRLQRF